MFRGQDANKHTGGRDFPHVGSIHSPSKCPRIKPPRPISINLTSQRLACDFRASVCCRCLPDPMDYHARHGHDVCSFDLPSTRKLRYPPLSMLRIDKNFLDRLPTVSAAQALEGLTGDPSAHVSTGLPKLDRALTGRTTTASNEESGLSKGQITEIWGPPGVGKTAVGIQAAVHALRDGKGVVWVDCFHSVCHGRFTDLYNATTPLQDDESAPNHLDNLVHFSCPTLAHFIALLCRPTLSSVPSGTALIVIDSLSALINHAFPRIPSLRGPARGSKGSSNRTVPPALC